VLLQLTLSKALLLRYESEEAIDLEFGPGTFKGVKRDISPTSPWRKPWRVVIAEQTIIYNERLADQEAALDALNEKVHECKAAGVHDSEIMRKVQKLLSRGETPKAS